MRIILLGSSFAASSRRLGRQVWRIQRNIISPQLESGTTLVGGNRLPHGVKFGGNFLSSLYQEIRKPCMEGFRGSLEAHGRILAPHVVGGNRYIDKINFSGVLLCCLKQDIRKQSMRKVENLYKHRTVVCHHTLWAETATLMELSSLASFSATSRRDPEANYGGMQSTFINPWQESGITLVGRNSLPYEVKFLGSPLHPQAGHQDTKYAEVLKTFINPRELSGTTYCQWKQLP